MLFQIHIELEDHRFGSGKKKKKKTRKILMPVYITSTYEPTNEYA